MNIYPGQIIHPCYRKPKKPLLPWYAILFFGIVFGYLLGLVHQAAQHHHRQTCETCRTYCQETAE